MNSGNRWPQLPYESWNDALDTLHMKMQIIGKVKLKLTSFLNHWWNVTFHLNLSGMTTGLIPYNDGVFEIQFNFKNHTLEIRTSKNQSEIISLFGTSVAEFYHQVMNSLASLRISVNINTMPCEFANPLRFELDNERKSYDHEFVQRWSMVLLKIQPVMERFRAGFRGKSSPVHFFWGSFDLSNSFYNGKSCAYPENGGIIMKYAENEENFTFGFWPGDKSYPHAAFYSYFYPAPKAIQTLKYYSSYMREFILDYHEVSCSPEPEETIMKFFKQTYKEGSALAGWDFKSLICDVPAIKNKQLTK